MIIEQYPILPIYEDDPTNAKWGIIAGLSQNYLNDLLRRVRYFGVDVKDFGAKCDGVTDDHAVIQALIDNPIYTYIRIGDSVDENILLSQPLIGVSNKKYDVNATAKIKDATITTITQNVTAGDTIIYVTSTSGFNIGEQVSVVDNILPIQGGGTGQTRREASSGVVKSIGSNYIELESGSQYNVSVANGGRIGHTQSVMIFDSKTNFKVTVNGCLDGNWTNQLDCEPVKFGGGEDVLHGCCLSIYKCTDVDVYVKEAKNALLHNVSFYGRSTAKCENIKYSGYCHSAHDKNTLVGYTDKMTIGVYEGNNSVFEDGIIFYLWCTNIAFDTIRCSGNGRYGISWGNYCTTIVGTNLITSGNRTGVNIMGRGFQCTNIQQNDPAIFSAAYAIADSFNIVNWNFNNVTAIYILRFRGDVKRGNISNLNFNGCNGTAIFTEANLPISAPAPPTEINIVGGGFFNHTGTKTDFAVGTDIVFTAFRNL